MLDPLYHLAANAIVFFHKGFGPIFGHDSFFAWAFSVVLLVICVRILIFPLFVKQVKSQRTMQLMQPKIKEIRDKHGHDRQRMNAEIMALQREHGNPLLGCLPIVLQIPLFIALFHVFNHLKPMNEGPGGSLVWRPRVGLSADQVEQIAEAKLLGISLSTSFTSSETYLGFLNANGTNVKIAAVVLIVLMGATTFFTQKQIMARTGPVDPQQAIIQKVMLYGSPVMLAVFGFQFPIAVLLYWLTTNLWSMGQQFFVIKKMPPLLPAGAGGATPGARPSAAAGGKGGASRGGNAVETKRVGKATVPSPAKPAPGARPATKAKNRPKPAPGTATANPGTANPGTTNPNPGTTNPAGAPGSSNGARNSAPPGTRSPKGNGQTTKATGGAEPDTGPESTADNVPGPAQGAASPGDDRTPTDREPQARPERSSPVPAGARRPPGGSRPAKRRGKGGRPGGRR